MGVDNALQGQISSALTKKLGGAPVSVKWRRLMGSLDVDKVLRDRKKAYGSADESFGRIAVLWSDVLGYQVTPQQVASCMIMLKVARLLSSDRDGSHDEDSVVDIQGYAKLRVGELNK